MQRTVLKAQQELLALNAQVRTTMDGLEGSRRTGRWDDGEGPLASSMVLRDARAELEALSGDPSTAAVVVTDHRVPVLSASMRPTLSPYEIDNANARVRLKVPARAARTVRLAPIIAIVLASAIGVGTWGWANGWRLRIVKTAPPASTEPADVIATNAPAAETTGMTGRSAGTHAGSNAGTGKPARGRPAHEAGVAAAAGSAFARPAPAPDNTSPAARQDVVTAAERWLDAYYRQDAGRLATLSTASVTLSDERSADERLPPGQSGVRRTLSDPTVQVFGTDAILTAKILERSGERESSSFISQMWTRRAGVWQVTDVRIVSAAAVQRAFKR